MGSSPSALALLNRHRASQLCRAAPASGVSRISARGVLKVRPHTKSGGGASAQVRYTKSGGGGGGGGGASGPIYEKWRGGGAPGHFIPTVFHADCFVRRLL